MPPEELWGNDDALERWFEDIKIRRGKADNPRMESVPDPSEMTGNAWAKDMIGSLRG